MPRFDSEDPAGDSDSQPDSHEDHSESESEEEDGALFDLEADEHDSDEHDSDDDEDSESDEDDGGNRFVELEASDEHDTDSNASSDDEDLGPFHPFMRLPPELRRRVWQLFCPPLERQPQVLHFTVDPEREPFQFTDTIYLHHQTAHVRAALATHPESRGLVLSTLPDTLRLAGAHGTVRFNKARDVVVLDDLWSSTLFEPWAPVEGFSENVRRLALPVLNFPIDPVLYPTTGRMVAEYARLLDAFPHLETVYHCFEAFGAAAFGVAERAPSFSHAELEFTERSEHGIPTTIRMDFFWPEVGGEHERARAREDLAGRDMCRLTDPRYRPPVNADVSDAELAEAFELSVERVRELAGMEVWPMVFFDADEMGSARSPVGRNSDGEGDGMIGEPSSPQDGGEESEEEQYESDFVVGDDNVEYDTDHDEVDELDDPEEPSAYYPQDSGGYGGGFSDPEPETDDEDEGLGGGAFFSYPEQQLGDLDDVGEFQGFSDPEESDESDDEPAQAVLPRRGRAIVISSDVESEDESEPGEGGHDRPITVDEDEDDEDEEGEEEGGAVRGAGASRNRRRRVVEESDDDE